VTHRPDPMTLNLPNFRQAPTPAAYRLVPLGYLQQLDRRLATMRILLWAVLASVALLALVVGVR
jgi:hypothetical protein